MKILLAIDGSPSSDAAVSEVCRRPWPPESEIRLVTVLSPVESSYLRDKPNHPMTYDDVFLKTEWKRVKYLEDAANEIEQRAPNLPVTPVLLVGRPKDEILDEAERWCPDLIVMGSHGYGKVRHIFLGSVSLAIALNAPCSVEIVRSPFECLEALTQD